ncbi:hypothetical protein FB45DRAFT_1017112 [Roridomyces roridus]|uniref:Uncharacterized protein n=1 Tax=Roridomyces roridus TaxID=1738132 RepID=A0AAD7CHU9_9AGAR|nr:hypothetical protein FB45DRAFT_1017112 [Roridomyces roridus]
MFTASYTNEPDARNIIPVETLGSFVTQHWQDYDSALWRDYQRKSAEARLGRIEAGYLSPDAPSQDYCEVWTAFSVRSRAARKAPGALQALPDIHVAVNFDLSTVHELHPARRFEEEELTIQRYTASEVCDSFASMLPLFVGGVSEDIDTTDEVLNDGI